MRQFDDDYEKANALKDVGVSVLYPGIFRGLGLLSAPSTLGQAKVSGRRKGDREDNARPRPGQVVAVVKDHQEIVESEKGDAHQHGIALGVLAAPVEVVHHEPEQDRASLSRLPDRPGLGDFGDSGRQAVELDNGAVAP